MSLPPRSKVAAHQAIFPRPGVLSTIAELEGNQRRYVEAVGGYERVLQDAISVVELGNVEVCMAGVAFFCAPMS